MDIVTITLAILLGLLIGVLLTLLVDDYRLGRRLKTAVSQKREVEEKLKLITPRLNQAEIKVKETTRQLSLATSQITQLNTEYEKLQHGVQTAESNADAAQNNLNRVCGELEDLRADNNYLRQKLETAVIRDEESQAQINGLLKQITETQNLRNQLFTAEEALKQTQEQLNTLQSRLTLVQRHMKANDKNELVIIKGIGAKYAERLAEAGVDTLAALADQTPEHIADILKLKNWQTADITAWIEEAKQLINDQPDLNK